MAISAPPTNRVSQGEVTPAHAGATTSAGSDALRSALQQFDAAADQIDLEPGLREILRVPQRELTVRFPVTRDDGGSRCSPATASSTTSPVGRPRAASASIPRLTSTRSARWRCG